MRPSTLFLLCTLGALTLLLHYLPLFSRRGLWFAITVEPDFRDTPLGRRPLHYYRLMIWAASLIAAMMLVASDRFGADAAPALAFLLQTGCAIGAFAWARRLVRPYAIAPPAKRMASLSSSQEGLPGGFLNLLPVAVLVAAALYLRANWERIPDRFPKHWNFDGVPDAWAERTFWGVYGPLLTGVLLIVFILTLGYGIIHGSPRTRTVDSAKWTGRFRRASLRLLLAAAWSLSGLFAAISLLPLMAADSRLPNVAILAPFAMLVILAPFAYQLVRVGLEAGSGTDGTPDSAWKLGQIYFNPSDPAILVTKRFGLGYTLNFGNRVSWFVIGLLLLAFAVAQII